jgi:LmbE family N-acetylglucosaminyl deacetylase
MGVRGSGRKAKATAKRVDRGLRRAVAQIYHVYAWVVKNGHHNHHHCGRGVITTAVAAPVVTITISRLPAKTYVIAGFQPSLQARKFRFTLVIGVTAG